MNTRSFQCFLVAAYEMNFSRAAEKLYMSQQSLSAHIKKLEDTYDVVLFERNPHLKLTFAGERMLLHAKNFLAHENRIQTDFANISEKKTRKISIGISRTRSQIFLPLIWERFHPQNPNINISLIETISEKMEHYLLNYQIDLYIGINAIEHKAMEIYHLADEKQYCVINRDLLTKYFPDNWRSVLNEIEHGIGPAELALISKLPFILLSSENRLRSSLDFQFHSNNIIANCLIETLDQSLVFDFSQRGYGVGFISKLFLYGCSKEVLNNPSLYIIPIIIDTMDVSIDLVTLKSNESVPHINNFIQITKNIFEEYSAY